MKLLIEIPSDIKDYIDYIELNSNYVRELIRCGTPLNEYKAEDCISRKEAIKLIDAERKELHWIDNAEDGLLEARRIINTLPSVYPKKVDCNDCYWNESSVSAYPKNKCKSEDCIKREEVCKYVHEFGNNEYSSDEEIELLNLIVDGIRHLPSACPVDNGKDNNVTTKTGHWIYNNALFDSWTCSCCKCDSDKYTDYCPHCGAFMNEDVIEKQKGENT